MLTQPFLWLVSQDTLYYHTVIVLETETHLCWVFSQAGQPGLGPPAEDGLGSNPPQLLLKPPLAQWSSPRAAELASAFPS